MWPTNMASSREAAPNAWTTGMCDRASEAIEEADVTASLYFSANFAVYLLPIAPERRNAGITDIRIPASRGCCEKAMTNTVVMKLSVETIAPTFSEVPDCTAAMSLCNLLETWPADPRVSKNDGGCLSRAAT